LGTANWIKHFESKSSILSNAIDWIKSKWQDPSGEKFNEPFPFYNWLETY
jgi:hypothetical protein